MKAMSAREAKNGFGRLIDLARLDPVTIEKHGRGVVVVMAVEDFERLQEASSPDSHRKNATPEPSPGGQK